VNFAALSAIPTLPLTSTVSPVYPGSTISDCSETIANGSFLLNRGEKVYCSQGWRVSYEKELLAVNGKQTTVVLFFLLCFLFLLADKFSERCEISLPISFCSALLLFFITRWMTFILGITCHAVLLALLSIHLFCFMIIQYSLPTSFKVKEQLGTHLLQHLHGVISL